MPNQTLSPWNAPFKPSVIEEIKTKESCWLKSPLDYYNRLYPPKNPQLSWISFESLPSRPTDQTLMS